MVAELLGGDGGVGVEGVLGEQCGRLARERHQRRRLAVRFGEVVLEGEALLGGRAQLHDLALHERLERARHLLRHLGVLEAREGDRRAREEIVAREDGRLVRVELVDGLGAAPRVGGVEDVVVHQRRRVDHLGDRRQGELLPVPLGALAVRVRRRTLRPRVVRLRGRLTHQQHDHRAHALPLPRVPRAEEVLRRLHQRLLVGAQLVAHAARERRNVVGDERERVGGRRRVRRHGVRAVPLQADRVEVAHHLRHVRALNYLGLLLVRRRQRCAAARPPGRRHAAAQPVYSAHHAWTAHRGAAHRERRQDRDRDQPDSHRHVREATADHTPREIWRSAPTPRPSRPPTRSPRPSRSTRPSRRADTRPSRRADTRPSRPRRH